MPPRAVLIVIGLVLVMGAVFVVGAVTRPLDARERREPRSGSSLVDAPTVAAPAFPGAPPPLPHGNPRDERWPAPPPATALDDDPREPRHGIRPDCDDLDGLPRTLGDIVPRRRDDVAAGAAPVRAGGCARGPSPPSPPAPSSTGAGEEARDAGP